MNPTWHKSSKSATGAQCVELHHTLTQVRDSKNADGPALLADVTALVAAVKAGRFG
ncbi:MAG TPA: DUF397 domain-containing protein [Pseudonocardiaceae bacterium]|jgi:hypothetical protein|nr:DUF397 domain-containing protein [Pseudonocardiaceae bacterium]